MRRYVIAVLMVFGAALANAAAAAAPLDITLVPDTRNPAHPKMGDWLQFQSLVKNTGGTPIQGLVVWLSLVDVTPGSEQPVDLEDWSAHKSVVRAGLAPGEAFTVRWPLRLIQAGDYRVVISAAERGAGTLVASPFADVHIARKPTVESARILPVALGVPLLVAGFAGWRIRRGAGVSAE